MNTVDGHVEKTIFQSGSFFVFAVLLEEPVDGKRSWMARGHLFGIVHLVPGASLRLKGQWRKHPKYGKQFKVFTWEPWYASQTAFQTFFSNCIRGADCRSVGAICSKYAEGTLDALNHPARIVEEVEGNRIDLQATMLGWEQAIATCGLSHLLLNVRAEDIESAVRKFGSDAARLIKENPYRLMQIPGFDFKRADEFAASLGVSPSSPHRVEGAVLWSLDRATRSGHLFLRPEDVPNVAAGVPTDAPVEGDYAVAIQSLREQKAVFVEGTSRVYLPEWYEYERVTAARIAELLSPATLTVQMDQFLEDFQKTSQLELSEAQKDAALGLAKSRVVVITGLPGTGKSTSVRALVRLFEVAGISFLLMAPTGIASKRLSHITGQPASTIHRALGYDGVVWRQGPRNRLVIDAVIVDEVSMVDQELIYRLLVALRPDTILVLVGDAAQLPSVGPGNVLKELAGCNALQRAQLTEIFRQSAQGGIVRNSHRINNGEFPVLGDPKGTSEFRFIPFDDSLQVKDCIVRMAAKLKARDANFQVLAPKYGGAVGVDALNQALRQVLNPVGSAEWRGPTQHFRVGDRVMVIKNNYHKGVYNGDVGKFLAIDRDCLVVRIYGVVDDLQVTFTEFEAEETLRLAYAITVHKSQGSEFDTIILPVVLEQGRMLQRNLLYTAVTRAKRQVWLLGQKAAIQRAINNNKVILRNTVLAKAVAGVLARSQQARDCAIGTSHDREDLRASEDLQS